MSVNIFNNRKPNNSESIQISTKGQRSTCIAKFFRYDKSEITKILNVNASNEKALASNSRSAPNLVSKKEFIVKEDIVRCSITKSKSTPSGTFSLVIKPGKQTKDRSKTVNYLNALNPGDWVAIYLKKDGEITDSDLLSFKPTSGLKCLGIIENVRYIEIDDPNKGSPRLEYIITGKDFGKVFETSIFFNPIVNKEAIQTALAGNFLSDSKFISNSIGNATPDVIAKKLINFLLKGVPGNNLNAVNDNFYIPNGLSKMFKATPTSKSLGSSFIDILSLNRIGLHNFVNSEFTASSPLQGATVFTSFPSDGTIWSILQFVQNAAINEMYTELVEENGILRPALILRQIPFSNDFNDKVSPFYNNKQSGGGVISDSIPRSQKTLFRSIPRTSIKSTDIKQKNVGKSDHERINYIIATPRIVTSNLDVAYVAGMNVPSIQRYGLKLLQVQTAYVLENDAKTSNGNSVKKFCEKCVNLLQDWFFLAHKLYNGTIVTDGFNDYVEVGTNLFIEDVEHLYHIEAYTHTYENTTDGKTIYDTEFNVSRGQILNPNSLSATFIDSDGQDDPVSVAVSFITKSGTKASNNGFNNT